MIEQQFLGERFGPLTSGVFALLPRQPLTEKSIENIRESWNRIMQPAKLIVLPPDVEIREITPALVDAGTPIFDALAAEYGLSV